MLVTLSAVDMPAAKMKRWICASDILSSSVSVARPRSQHLGADFSGIQPASVVGDFDDDVPAFVTRGEPDGRAFRLAERAPLGRQFDAVIGGIAHHVGERILDQVEHLAVEFGLGAVHFQFDLLAEFGGEIANQPRQLLPGIADRLHARLHDAFLQFGGDVRQPLQRHLEFGLGLAARHVHELIAGQHQFGDHRHQMFERVDIDADRLACDFRLPARLGLADRLRVLPASPTRTRRIAEGALSSSSVASPGFSGRSST